MNLVILILITSVGVAKAAVQLTLNKSKTPCTVYAKDADLSNKNDGILYKGSRRENREGNSVKVKYGLCCPKSFQNSSVIFRSTETRAVCCQQGKGSICYSEEGYRACPGFVCLAKFAGKPVLAPFCFDDSSLKPEGRIRQPDLIVYKDKVNCKDPSKKYQIVTIKRGQKSPPAYRWCCSEDITSNFTAKPRDVCCGLSASQAPNNSPGMMTNVDTPFCCRKLKRDYYIRTDNNCEPAYLHQEKKDSGAYRVCRANSGGPQTSNLNEKLPLYSVLHYFFRARYLLFYVDHRADLFACDKKGSKLLYALQDDGNLSENPGACCPKNIFYSDAPTMAKECCVTFVHNGHISTDKKFFCSRTDKGFIHNDQIYYRPCDPNACKEIPKESTIGLLSNQTIITPFNVSQDVAQPLYGVYDWYKNKYFV